MPVVYIFPKNHLTISGWLPIGAFYNELISAILSVPSSQCCFMETILPRLTFYATNNLDFHKRKGDIQHLAGVKNPYNSLFLVTATEKRDQKHYTFDPNE